jgi:hypothetical protein
MCVLKTSTYTQNTKHKTRRPKNAVAVAHNKPWKNTPYKSSKFAREAVGKFGRSWYTTRQTCPNITTPHIQRMSHLFEIMAYVVCTYLKYVICGDVIFGAFPACLPCQHRTCWLPNTGAVRASLSLSSTTSTYQTPRNISDIISLQWLSAQPAAPRFSNSCLSTSMIACSGRFGAEFEIGCIWFSSTRRCASWPGQQVS